MYIIPKHGWVRAQNDARMMNRVGDKRKSLAFD